MQIDVHIHLHHDQDATLLQLVHSIVTKLDSLTHKGDLLMAAIDDLTAQVAANTTVIGSALTLIQGLAAQLAAAGTDPVKLAALQASLKQSDDDLAAAVAANTPAAPPTP